MTQRPRERKRRRLPRGQLVLLIAMAYGTIIALLLMTAGFVTLARQGVPAAAQPPARPGASAGHQGHAAAKATGPAPDIRITAEHRGGLLLEVKAVVSMNNDRDPLIRAKANVTVDMADMPGSHTKGPLELKATAKPGEYTAAVPLPMPGDYKVRVVVDSPVRGEATTTVPVGLAGASAAPGGR
ncbi:MAG: hypothetical protein GEV11_10755 [Streptosporangiales bacterium]|nr:hypothetical protein [Streptosporangiales bacterium]